MKVSKRLIYLVLSIAIIMTSIPFIGYAATPNDFPDLPSDWSRDALLKAVNNGLITGSNGKLMPLSNLTRAQMAAIVNKAFGATRMASLVEFTDVKTSDWYFRDLAIAYQMGTFSGSNGKMNPNKPISREEVFVVLAKAFQLPAGNERSIMRFRDSADVSTWAVPYVAAMIEAGYVSGSNGLLNPRTEIKRNEFAALMDNVVKHYITEPGIYTGTFNGNIIVRVPGVTFKDAVINGKLVVGDGVGTGQIVLENVEVKGPTVVRGQAQLVEAPGTPEVPAGPAVPPVVAPPVTPGNPSGGDGGGNPVVINKVYALRLEYNMHDDNPLNDRKYFEKLTLDSAAKLTFDNLLKFKTPAINTTIKAEIDHPDNNSMFLKLLNKVNAKTGKTYAVGIANRVVNYSGAPALKVLNKESYSTVLANIVATETPNPTDVKSMAKLLVDENVTNLIDDFVVLYGDENVADHLAVFLYDKNTKALSTEAQSELLVKNVMSKFNEIYATETLESLVGKILLRVELDDRQVEIKFNYYQ